MTMRSRKPGKAEPPRTDAAEKTREPPPLLPLESAAGEEDPGASLGDPTIQEAVREEAKVSADPAASRKETP
jgi:hypothetical protein